MFICFSSHDVLSLSFFNCAGSNEFNNIIQNNSAIIEIAIFPTKIINSFCVTKQHVVIAVILTKSNKSFIENIFPPYPHITSNNRSDNAVFLSRSGRIESMQPCSEKIVTVSFALVIAVYKIFLVIICCAYLLSTNTTS